MLIVFARILGEISVRFKQPRVLGELLAGILLGPSFLGWVESSEALKGVTEIAVFLIILQAGLEINSRDIINLLRGRAIFLAFLGFFIPFFCAFAITALYNFTTMQSLILAICISITALPVALRILEQFKILGTDIAKYSILTAILNDVMALLILGVILSLPENINPVDVATAVAIKGGKLFFLATAILLMYSFIQKLETKGIDIYNFFEKIADILGSEAIFAFLIIFVLIFSSLSELLEFHAIIGGFFGALLIDKHFFLPERFEKVNENLNVISNGFLAPIFFTALGLEFRIQALSSYGFIIVVILTSIVTKIVAGFIGGKFVGMNTKDALSLGIILNGRGVMELVVAGIAFQKGLIGPTIFTTLMLMGITTTFITPPLFQYVYKGRIQIPSKD